MGAEGGEAPASKVAVVVRVRPPLRSEVAYDHAIHIVGRKVLCSMGVPKSARGAKQPKHRQMECSFEHTLDMTSTQEDLWRLAAPKVDKVLDGYNATVFTYGMTGSGKTYSMLGPDMMSLACEGDPLGVRSSALTWRPGSRDGLLPRAVDRLFGALESALRGDGATATIALSYMQIYRESCYDLLSPQTGQESLRVREDARSGSAFVEGLSEARVTSKEACFAKLVYGFGNIAYRTTMHNEQSSRSHTILTLTVEQRSSPGQVRRGKLHLVDLAGNERWDTCGPRMNSLHIKELTSINQSLHALGNCVQALSKSAGSCQHVPFRSSVLTLLLKESLSGNGLILLLCTISSCSLYQMQTLCTLRFADRARHMKLRAQVNEVIDKRSLLEQSQAEVVYLRSLVAEASVGLTMQEKLAKLENENSKLSGENQELKQKVASLSASQKLSSGLLHASESISLTAGANRKLGLRMRCYSEPALPTHADHLSDDSSPPRNTGCADIFYTGSHATASEPKSQSPLRSPARTLLKGCDRSNSQDVAGGCAAAAAWLECATLKPMWSSCKDATVVEQSAAYPLEQRRGNQAVRQSLLSPRHAEPLASATLAENCANPGTACQAVCPAGHSLQCVGSSQMPSRVASYHVWHCDHYGCSSDSVRTPWLTRYHCCTCQYDLCEICVAGHTLPKGPQHHSASSGVKLQGSAGGSAVYAQPSRPRWSARGAAATNKSDLVPSTPRAAFRPTRAPASSSSSSQTVSELPPRAPRCSRAAVHAGKTVCNEHSAAKPEVITREQQLLIQYYRRRRTVSTSEAEAPQVSQQHQSGYSAQCPGQQQQQKGMTSADSCSTTAASTSSVLSHAREFLLQEEHRAADEQLRTPRLPKVSSQKRRTDELHFPSPRCMDGFSSSNGPHDGLQPKGASPRYLPRIGHQGEENQ